MLLKFQYLPKLWTSAGWEPDISSTSTVAKGIEWIDLLKRNWKSKVLLGKPL